MEISRSGRRHCYCIERDGLPDSLDSCSPWPYRAASAGRESCRKPSRTFRSFATKQRTALRSLLFLVCEMSTCWVGWCRGSGLFATR
jgi:hypothetical protein